MSVTRIAKRYAKALLSLADDPAVELSVEKDFTVVREYLTASKDFRILMRSPVIKGLSKKNVIKELLTGKISNLFMDFLYLVIDKGRDEYYTRIDLEFSRLLDLKRNIIRATVISATDINEELQTAIANALSKKTGKKVIATYNTDAALIGGVKVMMNDRVLDGSIKQQLFELQKRLIHA
ncbi:MAG: ATP synthase F1 subunit delta [Ignavibacteria bacterium]|nr:ATP synthase F1 subunit delta [Ignavibacteria bacterium]